MPRSSRYFAIVAVFLAAAGGLVRPAPNRDGAELHYGPSNKGLSLAVEIESGGHGLRFHLRNRGGRTVRVAREFSCSGYSHLWVELGKSASKLDQILGYDPERKGLSARPSTTVCTRNVPLRYLRIEPGASVSFSLPFADGETLPTEGVFRGHMLVSFRGARGPVQMHSPVMAAAAPR